MLENTRNFYGGKLVALDGEIGHIKDFFFDDQSWRVRYLVVDTGSWLTGRLVVLSPHAFGAWDAGEKRLQINLCKQQIEDSPSIESHRPVSRQYEIDFYRYYGWPPYWNGGAMRDPGGQTTTPAARDASGPTAHPWDDHHLQSTHATKGYRLHTIDGEIGTVTGFKVDDQSWAIRELVVETGRWHAGNEILISPGRVERIDYEESEIFVDLTSAAIARTPERQMVQPGPGVS